MLKRGLRVLTRQNAAVDLNRRPIGHGVYADPTADQPNAQRGMATEWMARQVRDDLAGVLLENLDDAGHVIDGVLAQMGLRAMRRDAAGVAPPAGSTFMCHDDIQLRRL